MVRHAVDHLPERCACKCVILCLQAIPSTDYAARAQLKERLHRVIEHHIPDTLWVKDLEAEPDVAACVTDPQVRPHAVPSTGMPDTARDGSVCRRASDVVAHAQGFNVIRTVQADPSTVSRYVGTAMEPLARKVADAELEARARQSSSL